MWQSSWEGDGMNIIDSWWEAISPKRAFERREWREALREQRNYDAGNYEKENKNWFANNISAENTDLYSRDTVRARARDLERNSDMMNSVTGAFKRNIYGSGYKLQSRAEHGIAEELESAWEKWCKKINCDVTGTQTFNEMMRMAVIRKKIDGGILFVYTYTDVGYLPFQLQMVEVDELDTMQANPKYAGNKVLGGIEYNQYNRAIGYWIRKYEIDYYEMEKSIFVPAERVVFYFSKKRPSQLREMSDMSHTLTRIRDVNEFINAVTVKERILACLSVFIKRVIPTGNGGVGRGTQTLQEPRKNYDGKMLVPGMVRELNAGDEIETVNPSGQAADATNFTKLQQRMIGAGQGISYEATSRDMSQSNYSSTRQGLIEDGETFAEEREALMNVMDEIYETFVISCVLAGKIDAKDFWKNKEKYFSHEWSRAPKPWIDPLKEANANRIALNTGQKTFKQICAENGKDWKDVIDDNAEVMNYAREKGLELGGVLFAAVTETPETDGTSTEDDV